MKRAVLLAFALGACAQTYTPVVDLKGVDKTSYETDLAECRRYAEQVEPSSAAVATAILVTAAFAALGAIAAAVDDDTSVPEGAGVFAALGGALGGAGVAGAAAETGNKQTQAIQTCLEGRGYKVLARTDPQAGDRA